MEANLSQNVTMEVSQPGIMPAPAAAGNAASAEEVEEAHPTLAEDGEKVDEEGATVVAAAQLEELIGPMDEEGEHFSAADAAEDDMVDSPAPLPSPPSSAVRVCHQVCNKAFQTSPCTSPSGLGEGGRREREPSAQLTPGEAEPKQSRQARIMRHLTNREMCDGPGFVGQLLDPQDKRQKKRAKNSSPSCGQKALSRQSCKEIPTGSQVFSHKWADKCSKGAHKWRFTCADVKARYSAEEEEGLDVFVPTPTPESHNRLEVYALQNGFYTRSLGIVAALLIGTCRAAWPVARNAQSSGTSLVQRALQGNLFPPG